MGAAPPRPRRIGSASAAPRSSAWLYGGLRPPRPHPGRARAARGSGPPARPRSFYLWGRSPHAPGGLAAQARPRGRARGVYGGPPRPHPGGASALRAALPTRPPSEFLSVGAAPPRPGGVAAQARPRGRSWCPGRHRAEGLRGASCCPEGASDSRGCGGVGAQPSTHRRTRSGWAGQSRAQRVLLRVPRKQQAPRRPRDQRALSRQSPCWPWPPPAAWISLPSKASSRSRIATASSAASWS